MIPLQSRAAGEPADVCLEPMTLDDAAILGAALTLIEPWSRYAFTANALTAYLAAREAGAPRFLIRVDGQLAGALGVRSNWLRGPYLQFLGVLPNYQSHGIGGLALAWFENGARANGERNLWVAASDFNDRALHFYESHGFHRVAALNGLIQTGTAEILMRKTLCDN